MRKKVIISNITCILMLTLISFKVKAQDNSDSKEFKPHGKLWGLAFGDFAYKADADTAGGGRGVSQYSKVPKDMNMFQFRRIYLGYNYEISEKFSAEFLLAAENYTVGGDLSAAGKFSPFVKLANLRWKNIWKGTDAVIGQMGTPAFSSTSEVYWGYRSIEKTITDIRGTSSYDFGLGLQGKIIPGCDNYGYSLLVANGAGGSKPETDRFKWFYGDVYAKFLDKKLMVDLYADYNRLNWVDTYHHARSMVKLFVGYTTPKLTVGAEVFMNDLMGDNIATRKTGGPKDTLTTKSLGYSVFVRGRIYKDKLGFFARYDGFDASRNSDNSIYSSYKPITAAYDPNTQEQFITAGIDYTPMKNVHIMPNVWYNAYKNAGPATSTVAPDMHDLVYRLTFYYVYGK